ncbi:hypothetical protein COCOBI_04-7510 [Coccomyxa sp. Obi]|nr:hypothetical protein COCOBI_04-7510 [Coccomyxa sp. Obi]
MWSARKEQGRKSLPGPELPDHLWSMIAGIVGPKDWARVSGTCKAFHRTQFRLIEVQSNRLDELVWLSKRWRTAQALLIQPSSLEGNSASADAEILELMSAAGALWPHNLRHLSVHAPVGVNYTIFTAVPQWVQQVLSNTHKLEVLVLNGVWPVPVAQIPMTALKHLAMTATDGALPADWACIESLCCLETLHIAVPIRRSHGDECSTPASAMHLLGCSNLRALHVRNLVPADLAVPATCRVTLQGIVLLTDVVEITSGFWQGIMAILPACNVFSTRICRDSQLKILESALGQPLPKLEELELNCMNISADKAPLAFEIRGAMPRLTRLSIGNGGALINVFVRSCVHLRSLSLEGDHGISFTAVHEAAMFRDIEQVEMQWFSGHLELKDTLEVLLQDRSTETPIECTLNEREGNFKCLLGSAREGVKWQSTSLDMRLSGFSRHPYNCLSILKCGACEECLKQAGLLQMYR